MPRVFFENAADFRELYAAEPLGTLEQLALYGEPINQVFEVDLEGEEATLTLYELPSSG